MFFKFAPLKLVVSDDVLEKFDPSKSAPNESDPSIIASSKFTFKATQDFNWVPLRLVFLKLQFEIFAL